ncbi:MAG: phosphatidate cytidylyltransferase, partial [Kiritimatiellia bacterium]
IGAFAVGTLCGRHKMFPRVSPAKSWEGLAGGIVLSVLVSLGLTLVAQRVSAGGIIAPLGLLGSTLLGALLAVLGVLGDLVESLFKRAAKIKDSGGLFKGMGGLLDTFDSLIFAAPVCYAILLWSLR